MRYQADKSKNENNNLKAVTLIFGIFILVISLAQVAVANQTASSGENVRDIEDKIALLENENKFLEMEIAQSSSLQFIEKEARKNGFIKTSSYVFLSTPQPMALNHK